MNSNNVKFGIPNKNISSVKFGCFNAEEIRQLSVKRISNPHSFDALNTPVSGGLYDGVFGTNNSRGVCLTCNQLSCCGHLGHIELPLPVYNPLFFKQVIFLLRSSCHNCKQLYARKDKVLLLTAQLEALRKGKLELLPALRQARNLLFDSDDPKEDIPKLVELKQKFEEIVNKLNCPQVEQHKDHWTRQCVGLFMSICDELVSLTKDVRNICAYCKHKKVIVCTEPSNRIYFKQVRDREAKRQYVSPTHVRQLLKDLWNNESAALSSLFKGITDAKNEEAINALFLDTLAIPSVKFRPARFVNGSVHEDFQSSAYSKVMMDCKIITMLLEQVQNANENKGEDKPGLTLLNKNVLDSIPGKSVSEKLENAWLRLQQHVNSVLDSDTQKNLGTNKEFGVRQTLEKKGGLFRKYMMGKRVNYAARSVISPDPYIATNEIGVPLAFAAKLTYPTPVTPWNIKQLRQAVINGPAKYPGATHVLLNGEKKVMISRFNPSQRLAVAKQLIATEDNVSENKLQQPTVVMRYLQTGDVLLVNRQPTLHRGSIMAHKAHVLPGEKTLRLHYANCKSYNADFDGDEMNAHFPQSELGRAEAMTLMLTDQQYLSAKDGKPLSCLIQDHMVAGVNMCARGSSSKFLSTRMDVRDVNDEAMDRTRTVGHAYRRMFALDQVLLARYFTRTEYHTLVCIALSQYPIKIKLLPPSLLKPQKLWSGKQIFSTLLINITPSSKPLINLQGKSKISWKEWVNSRPRTPVVGRLHPGEMCESKVVIRHGELLCGILDKAHYGATEFGLVHSMFEIYGGDISGQLLTCFARLFTAYLQLYKGFTLGVEDILTTRKGNSKRKKIIEMSKRKKLDDIAQSVAGRGNIEAIDNFETAHTAVSMSEEGGKEMMAGIDHSMKQLSNSINNQISDSCSRDGLIKRFPSNNLQLMVTSGAKGGLVNCLQISCSLGQIELEGQRPSLTYAGRSCPSFKPFDTSLRSGGFVTQRFLTGLRSQEYFFHCMAGREGLVDTAVKTSNSGYLQRCLVKSLESLVLSYDLTVRDNGGGVVQFLYGDDGVDVCKSTFLRGKQFDFLVDNLQVIKKQLSSIDDMGVFDQNTAHEKWKQYSKAKKKLEKKIFRLEASQPKKTSGFLRFAAIQQFNDKAQLVDAWGDLTADEKQAFSNRARKVNLPDPVIQQLRPDRYIGSTSERYRQAVQDYLHKTPARNHTLKDTPQQLERVFNFRYLRALCEPGEDVGLLAAQSVGEPSTQMTLNTFHFAGRGEMNVTLGIPRLREILMSNVKIPRTPHISVPVLPYKINKAKKLCKNLATIMFSKVLHKIVVKETVVGCGSSKMRRCAVTMSILPEQKLNDLGTTRKAVMEYIEIRLIRDIVSELAGQVSKRKMEDYVRDVTATETGESDNQPEIPEAEESPPDEDADENEPVEEEDGRRVARNEEVEYEDDGSDEEREVDDEDAGDEVDDGEAEEETMKTNYNKIAAKRIVIAGVYVEDYDVSKSNRRCKVIISMPLLDFNADVSSLVQLCAARSFVRRTTDVSRCMLVPGQGEVGDMKFVMEGHNFFKIFENQECFDMTKLYSNSVHSIASIYGIEAARSVIVQEVVKVFGVYGIEIDLRHLSLLADFMCVDGLPRGCNRHAIQSCSSPLQQITFETSCNFLTKAALHGFTDSLSSPSSNVVTGKVVKAGTGSFTLVYPLSSRSAVS